MEDNPVTPMPSFHLSNMPEFEAIPVENWVTGEIATREVLYRVWPTAESEDKRTAVIGFLQKLLDREDNPLIKVYPYGSVPLKAYLPHGDIDLTVVGPMKKPYDLSERVLELLEGAQQNESARFKITEINFINAPQVKLIKCIVDGITVDLSLNQLGGLCSLGFLELADTLIKKDHIFKRSIILIKAWFFYESRLLGASHGLISTYALEILILYIFCMHNDSLTDPLMVMYRFLEYYSQFDWDRYCMSIYGPVEKYSMANVTVGNSMNGCLLGGESLRDYIRTFEVPDFIHLDPIPSFPLRFLNIIDPLKQSNNLGKSVSLGNYFRIRCALRLAARRLGEIMLLPSENVGDGIKKFFEVTFETSWSSAPTSNEVAPEDENLYQSNASNGCPEDENPYQSNASNGCPEDENPYQSNASNGCPDACESVAVYPDPDQLECSNGYLVDCKSKAEDPNQLKGSNGSLNADKSEEGNQLNGSDDLVVSESETIDLSALGERIDSDLYYYEIEEPAEKYPEEISDDEIVLESPIPDENETSLNLPNLTGDYDNIMRSLLFGLDYHRFVFHWDALWINESRYSFSLIWNQPDRWPVR